MSLRPPATVFAGFLVLAALVPHRSLAWSDHASLIWPLLRTLPELAAETVVIEPLDAFVVAEGSGLETLLETLEVEARAASGVYAPRPDELTFRADGATVDSFLAAIRINPELAYPLYRQLLPGESPDTSAGALLSFEDLSGLPAGSSHRAVLYQPLATGDQVSPAQIIATASDEPDFGIDIGLFEDNGTEAGGRYGFGVQPFGNPNLAYGSQAPFHMGFYFLDWLTRTAQPDLLRTHPAERVAVFGALSDFAFATGHDYWGWRFAGWALHYIGDLSQPYHAHPLPGVSTAYALWQVVKGRTAEVVQRVSNRHGVIESYQHQRVMAALAGDESAAGLLDAIASKPAGVWDENTLVGRLALESVAAGERLDAALETHMPARYVSDPGFEWTGSGEEAGLVATLALEGGSDTIAALDTILAEQLERFGRYAHAWVLRTAAQAAGPDERSK